VVCDDTKWIPAAGGLRRARRGGPPRARRLSSRRWCRLREKAGHFTGLFGRRGPDRQGGQAGRRRCWSPGPSAAGRPGRRPMRAPNRPAVPGGPARRHGQVHALWAPGRCAVTRRVGGSAGQRRLRATVRHARQGLRYRGGIFAADRGRVNPGLAQASRPAQPCHPDGIRGASRRCCGKKETMAVSG